MRFLVSGLIAALGVMASAALAQDDVAPFNSFDEASLLTVDHTAWDAFLDSYVVQADGMGLVAYADVTETDHASLKAYLTALQAIDPTLLGRDEAFAYWVNLYNAGTIDLILDNYPVRSIMLLLSGVQPGPWKRSIFVVDGHRLTLDQVEHSILREFWDEPRVHYALNCASIGCPDLTSDPYTGRDLDTMLNAAARGYINSPRGVRVEDGKLFASSIFKWFKEDFGDSQEEVIAHFIQYAEPELAEELSAFSKIDKDGYDWRLNEPKRDGE
ncbi:MAG: DUF547 domain-containing protein [Pseudomonadota bacterium]